MLVKQIGDSQRGGCPGGNLVTQLQVHGKIGVIAALYAVDGVGVGVAGIALTHIAAGCRCSKTAVIQISPQIEHMFRYIG